MLRLAKYIDQSDEVNAFLIEAIPAMALRSLAETRVVGLAVVDIGDVMLAGNVINLLVRALDDLIGGFPLLFLRQMADVAGVNEEGGLRRHRLDIVDRLSQGIFRIRVCRETKTDVGVAELNKG